MEWQGTSSMTAATPPMLLSLLFQREQQLRRERAQCDALKTEVETLEREVQCREECTQAMQQRFRDLEEDHQQLREAIQDEYEMRLGHARFEREMLHAHISELNVRILAKKDIWYELMHRCEALERRTEVLELRNEVLERRNQELEALTTSPSSEAGGRPPL